jgi:hypothetical protein
VSDGKNQVSHGRLGAERPSPEKVSDAGCAVPGSLPCPHGEDCPDAHRYGAIHPAPPSAASGCGHPYDDGCSRCRGHEGLGGVPCAACGEPVEGVLSSTMLVLCGCDGEGSR